MAIPQASFLELDGTITPAREIKMPTMGISEQEAVRMKQAEAERKFERSLAPNLVSVNIAPLLRGIRSDDPAIKLQAEQLYSNLNSLQNGIEELTKEVNSADAEPLKPKLKELYCECRRILDAQEKLKAPLGLAINNQRQANRDAASLGAALQQVRNNRPDPSKYPSEAEIDAHDKAVDAAIEKLAQAEDRASGWAARVNQLETQAASLESDFTRAAVAHQAMQRRIDVLLGKAAVGTKSSVNRSEFGFA
jgi:chromosome segregation ATPase